VAEILKDNFGREINYLRVAVTDRCNLRCFYCMPEEGINYLPRKELLTYEELLRLIEIFSQLGISKIRLTGGEPFIRKDLVKFIEGINNIPGINSIHITTNGVFTHKYLDKFKSLGIKSINLSLDTTDPEKFKLLTRRDSFDQVMETFHKLIEMKIKTKINMVVIAGKNTDDILPMLELTKHYPVDVRYIEEMPFNGDPNHKVALNWNHNKILETIRSKHNNVISLPAEKFATSKTYKIPEYLGSFGIIAAYSRTFCDSCNRVRLTSQGTIKTCLYDDGVLNLKGKLRSGITDAELKKLLLYVIGNRSKNGFEAEKNRKNQSDPTESMSTIGG
jgi:molybdenum cofactor biosynthesis protein A